MIIIALLIGHWYLSLFVQTFFHHRYAAHKMFTMNKFWEGFFQIFTYICQGSSYLSPRAYAIMHRLHHAYSDTEQDPHSPYFSKNVFDMMWETKKIYNGFLHYKIKAEKRFTKNIPEWKSLERLGGSYWSRVAWGLSYVAIYVLLISILEFPGTHWAMYFLLPIHFLMGPVQGAIVNWSGHKFGYVNYDNHDHSKNTLTLDFMMLGELFQNNHHKLPSRPNFAVKWFEFDPTYPVVRMLHWFKVIRLTNA